MPPNTEGTASRGKTCLRAGEKLQVRLSRAAGPFLRLFRDSSPNFELRKPDDVPIFTPQTRKEPVSRRLFFGGFNRRF